MRRMISKAMGASSLALLVILIFSTDRAIADSAEATVSETTPTSHNSELPCGENGPWRTAIDGHYVYWTDYREGKILRSSVAGGPVQVLATGQRGACAITVDHTSIYWTDNISGNVMRLNKSGGEPVSLASGEEHPGAIDIAGGELYFVTGTDSIRHINVASEFHADAGPNGSGSTPHCPVCPIWCNGVNNSRYICGWQSCGPCTS